MSYLNSARQALEKARVSIKKLASDALEAGDYKELAQLASMAQGLESMLGDRSNSSKSHLVVPVQTRRKAAKRKMPSRKRVLASVGVTQNEGPVFFRCGDYLVKKAKSKSGGSYEHKAPLEVLSQLGVELAHAAGPEDLLRMDEVVPAISLSLGYEVPSYQAYLCLAWLRREGLVVQHGRRGYTIPDAGNLNNAISESFKSLPKFT